MWSEKDKIFSRINALLLILVLTSENKIQMPENKGKKLSSNLPKHHPMNIYEGISKRSQTKLVTKYTFIFVTAH
jgi:hypothetical protein